jgi:hypothetical protein
MKNPLLKARIKETGELIEVYKTSRNTWCNYEDCKTEYKVELKKDGKIITESEIELIR